MSHEIEFTDGRANVLGRKTWWHRLNEGLGRLANWGDVEQLAPVLTMHVAKVPLEEILNPAEQYDCPDDMYVTARSDGRVLGAVGEKYEVVQAYDVHEWGLEMARAITGRKDEDLLISAGSIRNGRQFFFVFEGDSFKVGDVEFRGHGNCLGSHDGSMSNLYVPSNTVTVCANTYDINLGNKRAFTFRHTASIEERMALVLEAQRQAAKVQDSFKGTVTKLVTKRMNMREFDLAQDALFPVKDQAARTMAEHDRARQAVRALFTSPLQDGVENTAWAFVQSVNSYEQWNAPVRKPKGLGESTTRALRTFDSLTKGQPLTKRATELVLV